MHMHPGDTRNSNTALLSRHSPGQFRVTTTTTQLPTGIAARAATRKQAMGDGESSNKKSRSQPSYEYEVKQEWEEEVIRCGDGAGGGGRSSRHGAQMEAKVKVAVFDCRACFLRLKPPVFKCEGGHVVCSRCHGDRCMVCDRATSYTHCDDLDAMVDAVEVPCRYGAFGCERYVVYHEAADHERECGAAPCFCPEPRCGFSASPPTLAGHLAAAHFWPVTEVRYAKQFKFDVPPRQRCRYLLVEKDDRCVFLVTVFASGPAATAVSLLCVRANAAAAPRFRSKVWVEVASDKEKLATLLSMVGSTDLSGQLAASELQKMCLTVPLGFVDEEAGENLLLRVRIEKL